MAGRYPQTKRQARSIASIRVHRGQDDELQWWEGSLTNQANAVAEARAA
jgi:hypothetical protein